MPCGPATVSSSPVNSRTLTIGRVRQVRAREPHFRFLVRERYGGVPAVRRAIAVELKLIASELAVDLGRFPGLDDCGGDDLRMAADLMVGAMLGIVLALLEVDP